MFSQVSVCSQKDLVYRGCGVEGAVVQGRRRGMALRMMSVCRVSAKGVYACVLPQDGYKLRAVRTLHGCILVI